MQVIQSPPPEGTQVAKLFINADGSFRLLDTKVHFEMLGETVHVGRQSRCTAASCRTTHHPDGLDVRWPTRGWPTDDQVITVLWDP